MGLHSTYGVLLDENLVALQPLFPKNRAETVYDYGLDGKVDARVTEVASHQGLIVVTRDAEYSNCSKLRLGRTVLSSTSTASF